jgi:hypothetical protein
MVMPLTRTIEETREAASSDSVSPTYLQVVSHGVAQHHISVDPVVYLLLVFNRIKPWKPMLRGQLVPWGRRPWRVNEFGSLLQT